ncbi:MAG: thiamine pyrophosphate-binding protein [Zoogloeaceae bacterium]|jgi:acetolactate synthase-1/2/3 large subunit|nr:thiamine pyrophosphate-binding protein [Zoogloeaceae bacterium]
MKIRVAEFIARHLVQQGIRHVFLMTGGGAMFLNDALGHQPGLAIVCNHHEQASAMAAEAYARVSGGVGVINVTTGPGGINALNGVFGAWTDSVPMLILSGQVKRETSLRHTGLPVRQLGDQEVDIVALAAPICKYVAFVDEPERIRFELEKALHLATHGRPGPCWLDIPIDVQSALIDPELLVGFIPFPTCAGENPPPPPCGGGVWGEGETLEQQSTHPEPPLPFPGASRHPLPQGEREYLAFLQGEEIENPLLEAQCREVLTLLARSQRPVIMAGSGIHAAHALSAFEAVIRKLAVPVVTAWAHDLIASDDPLFCGRPGTIGTRAGNFTVQNADLLLVLGSRLNIRQVGYNWASFARNAVKIQVDIDVAELAKPFVHIDLPICSDVRVFLETLHRALPENPQPQHAEWLAWCRERVERYPVVLPHQRAWKGKINPYHFIETLFDALEADDIIACANAAACIVPFQVARIKRGMRLFSNSGSASMGYDLPAAIGAYYGALAARGAQRRVICLAGDGSIMLNLQELQTIAHHRLPIKIFILNNRGYLSIRSSQSNFFGRLTGEGPDSGVSFPDFVALGAAFGLPSRSLRTENFAGALAEILAADGPMLIDVLLDETQGFEPRMASRQLPDGRIVSPALEDMHPFLEAEELAQNMLPSSPLSQETQSTP